MKKILGIDVDDCICNTVEMDYACAYFLSKKNNKNNHEYDKTYFDVTKTFDMTSDEGREFFYKEKAYIMKNNSMYPKVFVKEVIHNLRKLGFKIIFITSRDKYFWNNDPSKYLKNWLEKFEIEYDEVYSNVTNKGELCKKLDVDFLIDDNPKYIENANNNEIKTITLKQNYNKDYKNNLNIFADNWLDLYTIFGSIYGFDSDDIINFD